MSRPLELRVQSWRLRRLIGTAFVALAVTLAILIGAVAYTAARFAAAGNAALYRWDRAAAYGHSWLLDLVNQETGVRGYALSHSPTFLQPYRQYQSDQAAVMAKLPALFGDDPQLKHLFDTMAARTADWQRDVAQPMIAALRAGSTPTAASLLAGKASFDRLRKASDELQSAISAKVVKSRQARTDEARYLLLLASLGVVIVFAAGCVLWMGLNRWVLGPVDGLAKQTREVTSGATHQQIVSHGPAEITGLGADVEAMRLEIANQLDQAERTREELARSNEDLQQFAYVASHDLSEPLRKVANFCQLLERQYNDQLDDRARQYIHFAVDGAKRMQALITDLLALSRVGRTTERFEQIDLDVKLDTALATLADRIAAADARVERLTPLPTLDGDRALLVSLFENLIGNAIKYRQKDVPPVVKISAEHDPKARLWTISVADNGIGIDRQYAERIFAVFQRLHLRDQYGGTGIGLALCRRIVEFHGGHIWLADVGSADTGSTFKFTLPESGRRAQSRD